MKHAWAATAAAGLLLVVLAGGARADVPPAPDAGVDAAPAADGEPAPPVPVTQDDLGSVRDDVDQLRTEHDALAGQVARIGPLARRLTGYLDIGFFAASGDGSGVRADTLHEHLPEYDGQVPGTWVLLGDPLATAVNSRGEPADTGVSRAFPIDTLDSQGRPTFVVNSLALGLEVDAGDAFMMEARVAFLPRAHAPARDAGLDDHVAVDLAYVRWQAPWLEADVRVLVGKSYSLMGIEYRTAEAPDRITITPTLLCRYTCGHPVGIEVRSDWLEGRLHANFGLTNGTHFTDAFDFHDELDSNYFKTLAARLSWTFPVGRGIEVGASGAAGAQDDQPENSPVQWHYGFDLRVDWKAFLLEAEWVKGKAPGADGPVVADGADVECARAPCLRYRGAYGLLAWSASPRWLPYLRVDWREATHRDGARFVYVSDALRWTVGVRVRLGTYVAAKAELVSNHELGAVPSFANDVVTTSLVLSY